MRYALPVLLLLGLIALFAVGLQRDPSRIPSPLIGKPVPAFALTRHEDGAPVNEAALHGRPLLVNFFASWCAGCQVEHPLLMELAAQGVEIVGFNYKDTPEDASRWLKRHGNPYRSIITDRLGSAGLEFGVYGVPETFVLDARGTIVHKHIGPLTAEAFRTDIAPLLRGRS